MNNTDLTLWTQIILASSTMVLVGITAYYAVTTNRILKESKRDRKVSLIKNQLYEFYYPLKYLLEYMFFNVPEKGKNKRELRRAEPINNRFLMGNNPIFTTVVKNRGHALHTETQNSLDEVLEIIHKNESTRDEDHHKHYDKLYECVNEDIKKLKNELEKEMN
ncbi:hypothetical protein [Methanolobus sp. ZRKC5]|uniref:hypothetical protein n=1 Tax=unclassified Methanolobus TaxID=2629569 RepID=UPI00313DB883